ncbi:MAG: hypothetical protein KI785_01540 [Devosiaceae bacterium]|nr:hypothetical protein [Devosiaceae bacterium MH13]
MHDRYVFSRHTKADRPAAFAGPFLIDDAPIAMAMSSALEGALRAA